MADSELLSGNVDEEIGQAEGSTNECEISGEIKTENREPSDTEGIQLYGTDKEQVWETGDISLEAEEEDDDDDDDHSEGDDEKTEATEAHTDEKDHVKQAMAQPVQIVVTIDEDAQQAVKGEADKVGEDDDDEMETAEAHDSEKNEDQVADGVEKGVLNLRMYKKEMRAEKGKVKFPDSFYKFRYLTVKIGPIKVDDLRTQTLHSVMYMATSRFEIAFDKLDVTGRNKFLGYVTVPFVAENPKMLCVMHNKLSGLSMTGRDMTVTFPDGIEEAKEDCKKYRDKITEIHEKYKEQVFQEKKRSLCARNIPDTVDSDTLKSKFPEAQKIWLNKYGTGLMGITMVFESRDKAKEVQAENTDLTIADKKVTLTLMIRKDNVQRRGRTTHADDELPMEFTGRAARRGIPPPGKGKKARKRARARAALAEDYGAAGQGGKRRRKGSAGGRQPNFETKRPLLGFAPMSYPRQDNPANMMAYLKSTLSRMEQKLTQRPMGGGYMDDGYDDSYGGRYGGQRGYQDDQFYGQSYGGVLGAGRQSGYGLGSMGFGGGADYGSMYDSYGGGSGYGGRGGKNRNKRGKRRQNRDAWD